MRDKGEAAQAAGRLVATREAIPCCPGRSNAMARPPKGIQMDNEVLMQILKDVQEIKAGIRWFKEHEESRQQAIREATENAAKGLANVDAHRDIPTI
jgi:hypothetical protein